MSRTLPLELSGRAKTALNLGNFVGAFVLQWGLGIGVDALRASGWSAAEAYRATFALLLALQAAGVTWMFVAGAGRHAVGSTATPGR
jgi:Ca2+/Na+ antiporter